MVRVRACERDRLGRQRHGLERAVVDEAVDRRRRRRRPPAARSRLSVDEPPSAPPRGRGRAPASCARGGGPASRTPIARRLGAARPRARAAPSPAPSPSAPACTRRSNRRSWRMARREARRRRCGRSPASGCRRRRRAGPRRRRPSRACRAAPARRRRRRGQARRHGVAVGRVERERMRTSAIWCGAIRDW